MTQGHASQTTVLEDCETIAVEGKPGNIMIISIADHRFEPVLLASSQNRTRLGMPLRLGRECAANISKQSRSLQFGKEA